LTGDCLGGTQRAAFREAIGQLFVFLFDPWPILVVRRGIYSSRAFLPVAAERRIRRAGQVEGARAVIRPNQSGSATTPSGQSKEIIMNRRTLLAAAAVVLGTMAVAGPADAQRRPERGWELLGTKKVGFIVDRDTIQVGRAEGRFRAVKLRVRGAPIHMMDLKVVYANGQPDDLPIRADIRAGGETRAIDLKGRERAIREVQMVYRSKPTFKGLATVEVWGLH
jgi:hypothetical protein